MHNCNWKYEYEVEHNRLVYAQTEIKKLRDTLEWVIAEAQRQKEKYDHTIGKFHLCALDLTEAKAEIKKLRDALEECNIFISDLKIVRDEDSCLGMAFVENRVSEDGYYIALNKIEEALKDGE